MVGGDGCLWMYAWLADWLAFWLSEWLAACLGEWLRGRYRVGFPTVFSYNYYYYRPYFITSNLPWLVRIFAVISSVALWECCFQRLGGVQ